MYKRQNQEILRVREETNGRIGNIQTNLSRVQDQTTAHRDEINSLRNRQCTGAHTTCEENREVIDFQNYR